MKRSPMKRGTSTLKRTGPIKAKRKKRPKIDGIDYLGLCRGQDCYLMLPHVHVHDPETVVPAHSNQARHGKGIGIKAGDIYTVPACHACHAEIDQGKTMTREQKFAAWDAAYARWSEDRKRLLPASA